MKVGVNLLWLVPGVVGGSEEYTIRLLRALEGDDLDLTLYCLTDLDEVYPVLRRKYPIRTLPLSGRNKAARIVAEATWLSVQSRRDKVDLMHHAGGILPIASLAGDRWYGHGRLSIPTLLTIHDLQPITSPQNFSTMKRRFTEAIVPRSAAIADRIVVPTEYVRATVIDTLDVPADLIDVVPHGIPVPSEIERLGDAKYDQAVLDRHGIGAQYFLYPAITYPHKNHRVLVDALSRLIVDYPDVDVVFTGGPAGAEISLRDQVRQMGLAERVKRLGRVPADELQVLYRRATAVAFPSMHEGFGAPVIEAMGWGAPVLAADTTSLPEVVGSAAILIPPQDPDAWAAAMRRVLDDPGVCRDLTERGYARSARYEPTTSAAQLGQAYRRSVER